MLTVLWLCRLPKKDNPRRGLWLANCQRLDPSGQGLWDPTSEYIYFCSKHFEENCFELVGIRWVFLPAHARTGCEGGVSSGSGEAAVPGEVHAHLLACAHRQTSCQGCSCPFPALYN